ncbi:peptidylprolyl isomerase [bacterium]|nr:peptidylprolyl isomerase [bacterium]
MRRSVEVLPALFFTLFAVLSPPVWAQEPVLLDEIVARVNEEIITLTDLKKELSMLRSSLRQENQSPELLEQTFQQEKPTVLRTMIQNEIFVQRAEEYGIPDSVEPDVGKILEEMREESGIPSMEVLDQYLRQQGSSLEEYRASLKQRLVIDAFLQQNVYSKLTLLTPEIEAYYQENIERYTEKAEVELKEILFLKEEADEAQLRKKAREVLSQLRTGASFEDLAKRFSDGPTASQGGGIGSFKQGSMAALIEEVAFQLEEGAVSGIIEAEYGFQIIKVVSRTPVQARPLEDVRSEISMQLYQRKAQPELKKFVDELIEQSYIYVAPKYREEYDVTDL